VATVAGTTPVRPGAQRLGWGHLSLINAFWFGQGAHWQPIFNALIPVGATLIDKPNKDLLVGKVTAAGGVFALLIPIVVGFLSDRTRSRFGRRRPWMVAGTIGNIIGLFLVASAGSAFLLIAFYLILQASNNVAGAAYSGVIPDVVPEQERGRASGLLGVMNNVGTIVGLVGVVVIFAVFQDTRPGVFFGYAYIAVLVIITLVISCAGIEERSTAAEPRGATPITRPMLVFGVVFIAFVATALWLLIEDQLSLAVLGAAVATGVASLLTGLRIPELRTFVSPFAVHDFRWVFLTRFIVQFGIFSIAPFINFYFQDVIHAGDRAGFESSLWLAVVFVAGAIPAVVCGSISDRTGRRKIFVYVAGGLQALVVATLLIGLVDQLIPMFVLGALFGIGYGTYYAVDWALACDVLPNGGAEAGKDMALWHISFTLPQVLAPALLAPVLHNLNGVGINLGYRVIFGLAAVWFLMGTVMVRKIRAVR